MYSRAYLSYEIADSSFRALQADTPWRKVYAWVLRRAVHSPGLRFLPLRAAFAPTGAFAVRRFPNISAVCSPRAHRQRQRAQSERIIRH
ncbi:hypothetical protein A4U98_07630 [Bifidobacterium animalis subsp. animalis]|nr:hypothetical protein A4U98_07630 [Bifidobacterium animalis subsp. animalis]PHQ54103.1 hypothetical protein ADH71_008075 [Bifidobacterium animalis subsp. animalis]